MAHTNWHVRYPVAPTPGPDGRLPLGGKLVSSLAAAMADAPEAEWTFEVRGEPVSSLKEFQRLVAEAESVAFGEGEFVARANGIVVEPA